LTRGQKSIVCESYRNVYEQRVEFISALLVVAQTAQQLCGD